MTVLLTHTRTDWCSVVVLFNSQFLVGGSVLFFSPPSPHWWSVQYFSTPTALVFSTVAVTFKPSALGFSSYWLHSLALLLLPSLSLTVWSLFYCYVLKHVECFSAWHSIADLQSPHKFPTGAGPSSWTHTESCM